MAAEHRPGARGGFPARDGKLLTRPTPRFANALAVGDWVQADSEPWRITDLRATEAGGRVVRLDGHDPVILPRTGTLPVYTPVTPPPRRN